MNPANANGTADFYVLSDYYSSEGMGLRVDTTSEMEFFVYPGNYRVTATGLSLTFGNWYQVVGTLHSGTVALYLNGSSIGTPATGAGSIGSSGYDLYAFTRPTFTGQGYGSLDEIRISTTALSANWIAAEYANQSAPGSFWSVSTGLTPIASQGGGYLILQ
jgi:hypothetical protein